MILFYKEQDNFQHLKRITFLTGILWKFDNEDIILFFCLIYIIVRMPIANEIGSSAACRGIDSSTK